MEILIREVMMKCCESERVSERVRWVVVELLRVSESE